MEKKANLEIEDTEDIQKILSHFENFMAVFLTNFHIGTCSSRENSLAFFGS